MKNCIENKSFEELQIDDFQYIDAVDCGTLSEVEKGLITHIRSLKPKELGWRLINLKKQCIKFKNYSLCCHSKWDLTIDFQDIGVLKLIQPSFLDLKETQLFCKL